MQEKLERQEMQERKQMQERQRHEREQIQEKQRQERIKEVEKKEEEEEHHETEPLKSHAKPQKINYPEDTHRGPKEIQVEEVEMSEDLLLHEQMPSISVEVNNQHHLIEENKENKMNSPTGNYQIPHSNKLVSEEISKNYVGYDSGEVMDPTQLSHTPKIEIIAEESESEVKPISHRENLVHLDEHSPPHIEEIKNTHKGRIYIIHAEDT